MYGGKRVGRAGRPPLQDWRQHRWWSSVSGAKASNWSKDSCWVWTKECKGQAPTITIRKKRVSVRRYLYAVSMPDTHGGVSVLDPDQILIAADTCDSTLCINPWHGVWVSRADFTSERVSDYWRGMNQDRSEAKRERQYTQYCDYVMAWLATGVQGTPPFGENDELRFEMMERFEKQFPGVRQQALEKSIARNRP
jgi:hypothetical protein